MLLTPTSAPCWPRFEGAHPLDPIWSPACSEPPVGFLHTRVNPRRQAAGKVAAAAKADLNTSLAAPSSTDRDSIRGTKSAEVQRYYRGYSAYVLLAFSRPFFPPTHVLVCAHILVCHLILSPLPAIQPSVSNPLPLNPLYPHPKLNPPSPLPPPQPSIPTRCHPTLFYTTNTLYRSQFFLTTQIVTGHSNRHSTTHLKRNSYSPLNPPISSCDVLFCVSTFVADCCAGLVVVGRIALAITCSVQPAAAWLCWEGLRRSSGEPCLQLPLYYFCTCPLPSLPPLFFRPSARRLTAVARRGTMRGVSEFGVCPACQGRICDRSARQRSADRVQEDLRNHHLLQRPRGVSRHRCAPGAMCHSQIFPS